MGSKGGGTQLTGDEQKNPGLNWTTGQAKHGEATILASHWSLEPQSSRG